MGTLSINRFDPIETARFLKSYSLLQVKCGETDIAGLPLTRGFQICKAILDERFGMRNNASETALECRIECGEIVFEGKLSRTASAYSFVPDEIAETLPKLGTKATIQTLDKSLAAITVHVEPGHFLLGPINSFENRRQYKRKQVTGLAVVHLPDSNFEGGLFDISEGGAGITIPQVIEVGSMVNLLLKIEGKRGIPFECDGMVTSCKSVMINNRGVHRVGIKFSTLPEELASEISKLS